MQKGDIVHWLHCVQLTRRVKLRGHTYSTEEEMKDTGSPACITDKERTIEMQLVNVKSHNEIVTRCLISY
jgi:hypothetical protein